MWRKIKVGVGTILLSGVVVPEYDLRNSMILILDGH
jgi:hypothetical protein